MSYDNRYERLSRDVSALRVAQAQLRGHLRRLDSTGPASDAELRRDVDRLSTLLKELTEQVAALQRWRWQVVGLAGGIVLVGEPLMQAVLHGLGVH